MHAAKAPPGLTRSTLAPVCAKRARPLHAPTCPSLRAFVALAAQGWPLFLLGALRGRRSASIYQPAELCICSRRVCVLSVQYYRRFRLIITSTVSRQRVRLTSAVVCEMRAFFVAGSLICRARQLASSIAIQGLCVVFYGLKYGRSNSPRREGGVNRDGKGCHCCHTLARSSGAEERKKLKDRRRRTIIIFSLFSFSAFEVTNSS